MIGYRLRNFFGEDNSQVFLSSLPEVSIKGLIFRLMKILILAFIVPLIIGFTIIFFVNELFQINNVESKQFIIVGFLIYPLVILFSIRYFYFDYKQLKSQYLSVKIKSVFKHTFVIASFITILAYFTNIVHFLLNPSDIETTFKFFETLSEETIFNPYVDLIVYALLWISVAIGEEILFGGIFRTLRNNYSRSISIVVSSTLFMLLHHISITSSFFIFISSVIDAIYFEYKNNLLTPTILHFLQNFLIAGISAYSAAYTVKIVLSMI